jgi:hypothetical protein
VEAEPSSEEPARTKPTYWLTRFVLLRLLGIVYAVAFLVAAQQLLPLIGSHGLLPLENFLPRVQSYYGSTWEGFLKLPSLFWLNDSDTMLTVLPWIGFGLSCVVIAGFANSLIMIVLWALYMSIVHVGQDWYGFGWETQLLETGFLAIFLVPSLDPRPFPRVAPPILVIWLFRWLIFRIMIGSALIKLRGDPCWRDLTALFYYFETQPIPNPLSRWFHFLPHEVLKAGVLFNFLAELIAPWFVFWPRIARHIAGSVIILFLLSIAVSGNLSFLNWLTIIPALACFDDSFWWRLFPGPLKFWATKANQNRRKSIGSQAAAVGLTCVVAFLSIKPVLNLLSPQQMMNTSFDPFDLVNTYGAFGTIGRERLNVVFQGTDSDTTFGAVDWKDYLYQALPVDTHDMPVQVAPYQPHLDWQMWFAAMGTYQQYPWTLHLVWKLLHNDPVALSFFRSNPFPDHPPRYIRAVLYKYSFAPPGNANGDWWTREFQDEWLPPLSIDNPNWQKILNSFGWTDNQPEQKTE